MKKLDVNPVRGTRDFLPKEAEFRDLIQAKIVDFYKANGFRRIETPVLENIDLLLSSQGGENEKLIFKIIKRGDKLKLSENSTESEIVDYGLRFDLTVPLSRFYANNAKDISLPFKSIQIGPVWRAERPQRGRFRQFVQCDIDILGESSIGAEIDLILTTTNCLCLLGLSGFNVRINHRQLLEILLSDMGFESQHIPSVMMALDKLDKIGVDGVTLELEKFDRGAVSLLTQFMKSPPVSPFELLNFLSEPSLEIARSYVENMTSVISSANIFSEGRFSIIFDPFLVRGMGYYTGQIFEVNYKDFPFSIAGGGRYDAVIGRLLGRDVSACGFSIGFERIIGILQEENSISLNSIQKAAVFYSATNDLVRSHQYASALRKKYDVVSVIKRISNHRRQLDVLWSEGYRNAIYLQNEGYLEKAIELQEMS